MLPTSSTPSWTRSSLGAALAIAVAGCADLEAPPDAGDGGSSTDDGWMADHEAGPPLEDGSAAGDAEEDGLDRVEPGREIWLTLETREGMASQGWSFSEDALVEADHAHIVLSSFDCGARGRWVTLEAQDADICPATPEGDLDPGSCSDHGFDIGGSDPEVELGDRFFVRTEGGVVPLVLVDRTETPFDWYEAEDLSFDVVLAVADEERTGPHDGR